MAKKKSKAVNHNKQMDAQPSGNMLKDLLNADVLDKLKLQAKETEKAEQERKQREKEKEAEAKRQAQKKLENDFSYLLDNSDPNWSKYK
ncbi:MULTISPECIES: YqkE family protein [unclassified Paenibacillus]|uniref:YqkE family protein n=1 Tax=unclassified Paenibacillus TaxID=185978 RepID=UPI002F417EC9